MPLILVLWQLVFPEQQVVHFLLLQCCSSDVSAGDLGKGPACKVQGSCWVEKILGVRRIKRKQMGFQSLWNNLFSCACSICES